MLRRAFATADVLSVHPTGLLPGMAPTIVRSAHRAVFHYEPQPGMLYVRSRAISSRCNDNFDYFPAEEIKAAYCTFVGKPVFVNHHNDDHKRMRGLILDAALHEDRNPDGSPDTWAEVLMEVDGWRYPKLARALIRGDIDRTSMGCFIPGTLVTRADGTQIPIERIELSDEVLTHTGKTEPVTYVMKRDYEGLVYDINTYGRATPLVMTPEHPVWVRSAEMSREQARRRGQNVDITVCSCGRDCGSYRSLAAHLREARRRGYEGVHEVVRPENAARWVEAKDVNIGDWVLTPRSAVQTSPGTYTEARLLGYYLAEGNLCWDRKRSPTEPVGVEWTFHENELEYLAEVKELVGQLGYVLVGPYQRESSKGVTVRVNSPELARRLQAHGGMHSWGKKISAEVMGWSPANQRALLTAYWNGDGHYEGNRVEANTVSESLAQQLHVLAIRCDIPMTPPVRQHSPSAATLDRRPKWSMQAVLTESDTQRQRDIVVDEAGIWRRVTGISIKQYTGPVHNFDVEGDDSYVAADVAVHNCDVETSTCSACGNVATMPSQYCAHIPGRKGNRITQALADGRSELKLIYEECRGLAFFENSLLVEPPADPTAFRTHPVELGPGLEHLARTAGLRPVASTRSPIRLDKPVEILPDQDRPRVLSHSAALASENSRIWGLLAEASSPSRPRDLNGEIWRLLRQGNAGKDDPGQDSEFLRNYPSDSEIDEMREGGFGGQEPWHPYRHELESRPEPRVGLPKQVKGEYKGPNVGTVYNQVPHGTKGAMNAPSPSEEYHGPYEVMRHAQTGKYHVVDNQDRVTEYGNRNGMDDRFQAEHIRDYAEHKQRSKEIGRGIADKLWSGFQEAMDPGGTEESRESERNVQSMNNLQNLGYQPHHIKFDDEDGGRPHAEIEHTLPGGKKTGWFGVDHGGSGYLEIKHRATGDESHDAINLSQHENGQEFRKPGYGPAEAHGDLHHWHSGPEEETGGIRQHFEETDPRIRRWKQRHGVRNRRSSAYIEPPWLGMVRTAYGEIKSPPDVDTLRDEACPICGNDTAYAGRECQICGYILPIKPFADPDVDKARQLDQLRDTVDDQLLAADPSRKGAPFDDPDAVDPDSEQPALGCPNCGETVEPGPPQTTDAPGVAAEDQGPAAGDPCPSCGEAELEPVEPPVDDEEADPDSDELDQDRDQLPDDEENKKKSKNPASAKDKTSKLRTSRTDEGDPGAMTTNPGLRALAAQQQLIERLQATAQTQESLIQRLYAQNGKQATQIARLTAAVTTLAQLGGPDTLGRVKVAMIRKKADEQNPAQPIPEPAPQPPTETTTQAKTPEAFADVTAPGMVPGTTQDVAADAVTTAYTPGQDIAAAPFHNLIDVTAPVDGAQGPRPINEVRTETDVRVGNPMNPQVAYPIGGPFAQTQRTTGSRQAGQPSQAAPQGQERFTACLRLARLQIQAGLVEGEDLALAQRYARDVDNMPDVVIAANIQTLSQLQTTAAARSAAQPPRNRVPQMAGAGVGVAGIQRTLPPMPLMAQASQGVADNSDDDLSFIGLDLD